MKGMMMHQPLLVSEILEFGAGAYPRAEIVSVRTEGDIHRETYVEFRDRTVQLAHALQSKLGVELGDRVATLAWNGYRHMELYYAISGIGAVCHTINPRLSAEQFIYIVNHAEDKVLFLDTSFVPIIEAVKDHLPKDLAYVIMTDRAHMPDNSFGALCYEELLEGQPTEIEWPQFAEDTACGLCYTSGTTGNPKGALYTHRSTTLHAMMMAVMQSTTFGEGRSVLPVVPLFHVNAWGLPYASLLVGMNMVMPGPAMDGPSLFKLMDQEKVFSAWGVPTIWQGLLGEIKKQGRKPEGFGDVVIGGSAAPRSMIEAFEKMDVCVGHAWGMTETSPIGTVGGPTANWEELSFEEKVLKTMKQGRPIFGVELRTVDLDDFTKVLPRDGETSGALQIRGPWVVQRYFKAEEPAVTADGWFDTGDVGILHPDGTLQLTDRTKDVIKSGGEWISSVELENAAVGHPAVAEAACVGMPHPKWDERPVLFVVRKEGIDCSGEEVVNFLSDKVAKWWLPDAVEFVDDIPHTATGKISKKDLRDRFSDYQLEI